jgi:hypothetical protein
MAKNAIAVPTTAANLVLMDMLNSPEVEKEFGESVIFRQGSADLGSQDRRRLRSHAQPGGS